MKTNRSTTEAQDDSAEGGDIKGSSLEEEEKIGEDVIVDRMSETQTDNSSNGKLKTPEDERGEDIADATDAHGKMNESVQENMNNEDATSSSHNQNRDVTVPAPGVMFVPGPDYTGMGITPAITLDQMTTTPILSKGASFYKDFYQKMIRHVGEGSRITRC